MGLGKTVVGVVATVIIGGTAYTISQKDVVNNFAKDSGMTQDQAQQYVNNVGSLVPFDQIGNSMISDANDAIADASKIDCINYTYKWESAKFSCDDAKNQLNQIGNDEKKLGNSYGKLSSSSASKDDISTTIRQIDTLNSDYNLPVVILFLDQKTIIDTENTNTYNKATLEAALGSN